MSICAQAIVPTAITSTVKYSIAIWVNAIMQVCSDGSCSISLSTIRTWLIDAVPGAARAGQRRRASESRTYAFSLKMHLSNRSSEHRRSSCIEILSQEDTMSSDHGAREGLLSDGCSRLLDHRSRTSLRLGRHSRPTHRTGRRHPPRRRNRNASRRGSRTTAA